MKVFVVHKQGVYRHKCFGVFESKDAAIAAAIYSWLAESDMYHNFDVRSYALNDRHWDDGDLICRVKGNCDTSMYDKPSRDVMEVEYADNKETQ